MAVARITKPFEERRQEVIDTARELFLENGFDKTQMSDISKKMNVAQGLVYHYFKSKTDVLYAVFDQLAGEKLKVTQQLLTKSGGTALDRMKLLFVAADSDKAVLSGLGRSIAADPAIVDYCKRKLSTSVLPAFVTLIEEGNDDGSLSCAYPKEVAAFIWQGFTGVFSELADMSKTERDKMEEAFKTAILRVLGAKEE
jgi:AcrR family transcriptional regulator